MKGKRRAETPPLRLTTLGKAVVATVVLILAGFTWSVATGGEGAVTAQQSAGSPSSKLTPSSTSSTSSPSPSPAPALKVAPRPTPTTPQLAGVDLSAHSHTDPESIWTVVNKQHPLNPEDYAPDLASVNGEDVAALMAPALEKLLAAAREAGAPLRIVSSYRSYGYQTDLYGRKKAELGTAGADQWSARPGHSEHQIGLAVDLDQANSSACELNPCFADTSAGRWLARHAADFGFIVRYTAHNEWITGYNPEPWHIRYVGTELAQAMKAAGVDSLEEVFGVTGGDYDKPVAPTT